LASALTTAVGFTPGRLPLQANSGSIAPADALAMGQVGSAAILQYIREMGADPELLNEMSKAGSEEINVLPRSRLHELGVVNDGEGKTTWIVETSSRTLPQG